MLRLSDKRSCAVSYSPHRTLWLSRADGGSVGPNHRHLQNDARNRFRSAQTRSHSPVGLDTGETDRRKSHAFRQKNSPTDLAHFAMLSRGNCWLSVKGIPDPIPLTGGDCFLLGRDTSIVMRDSPRTRPRTTFREIGAKAKGNVAHHGGGGAPTTIVCGSMSFDRASLRPITQLLPSFILIKAEQARTLALHDTMRALASEMAEQVPGSEIVANRLAEVLFTSRHSGTTKTR
ncbi:MAG TPA: cupin domain-containing protein [Acidobacteriaceae bacterium]|nr:cupin domain-containing protein [Acidobacteriaceae bacterium]